MAPKTRHGKTNKEGARRRRRRTVCGGEEESCGEEEERSVKKEMQKEEDRNRRKKRKQDSSSSSLHPIQPSASDRIFTEQHSDPDHSRHHREAENPLQAPITSNNREDPNRESHSPEAAINNEAQRTIGSNNSDSNPPEAAIGSATIDNDAPRTQQSEPHGIFEGQEEERVCEEPEAGGEAGRESVKELELRLNKRMDDGFALRDETIRLLAARVKELEQDKIQRENWSFQFGEYETCEASGGKGRDNMGNGNEDDAEGEEEAAKEAYEVAGNEDEVGQKEGETEADKEGETEEGKTDVEDSPSTLQVMAEAAEKLEKEVDDKAAAEKAGDELAAAEKAASDKEKVGDEEETRPKRTHKPSRPLRSPYQKN
ncbi:hypothetical protein Bca101_071225 [Brassica carinata]